MNSIQAIDIALAEIERSLTNMRRSKVYAMALADAVARVDYLHNARETLTALRQVLEDNERQTTEALAR